jgi:hypothetical protein
MAVVLYSSSISAAVMAAAIRFVQRCYRRGSAGARLRARRRANTDVGALGLAKAAGTGPPSCAAGEAGGVLELEPGRASYGLR